VPSVRGQLAIGVVQHSGAAFTELLRTFVISDKTPFGSDAGARSNNNTAPQERTQKTFR
jgi:hypothetical protein